MKKVLVVGICVLFSCKVVSSQPLQEPFLASSDSNFTVAPDSAAFADSDSTKLIISQKRWNSPVRRFVDKNPNLSRFVVAPAMVGGAWVATYKFADQGLSEDIPFDKSEFKQNLSKWVEPMGRGATIKPLFGSLMVYGLIGKSPRARKTAVLGITAFYLNDGLASNLKQVFSRMRPNSGADYNNWFQGKPHRSFPSAHTSTAFAAATVLATQYKDKKLVAPIAYTLAGLVGYSRLYENQHWASDVLGGALLGYASAKATIFVYDWVEKKWQRKKQVTLLPQIGLNQYSVVAVIGL